MANGRQFDPVAAAATSALDAQQRQLRQVRSQFDAPELPAESQAFSTSRNAIQALAQFSPANVAARGSLPSDLPMPGDQMAGVHLPGLQRNGGLNRTLRQLRPDNVLADAPDPLGILPGSPSSGGGGGGNSGSNNTGNNGEGNGTRDARATRSSYRRSR